MRVSWNWLSEMVDLSQVGGPSGLSELLTRRGLEVESIERMDAGFEKVVSAQILERNPHPQADRLSLCKVTLGSGEPLDIDCGAQNMKAGENRSRANWRRTSQWSQNSAEQDPWRDFKWDALFGTGTEAQGYV